MLCMFYQPRAIRAVPSTLTCGTHPSDEWRGDMFVGFIEKLLVSVARAREPEIGETEEANVLPAGGHTLSVLDQFRS